MIDRNVSLDIRGEYVRGRHFNRILPPPHPFSKKFPRHGEKNNRAIYLNSGIKVQVSPLEVGGRKEGRNDESS